jgi:predicted nucleotidyltransferase
MLFGSRTDDQKRGGDIDLLIELAEPAQDSLALSVRLAARIQRQIGLRKIDVLVADPATVESPLLRQARQDAVAV